VKRIFVRYIVLSFVTLVLASVVASVARAEWNEFWYGDIAPGTNKQTSSHQNRYARLFSWVDDTRCLKSWYRNDGSSTDYYIIRQCDGWMQDNRDSTEDAWTYCRNDDTVYIQADCYTCINTPGLCP
jgi:hypothetical protein